MKEAERALMAYKQLFKKRFAEGVGSELRSQDLVNWNKKQFMLWTKAVQDGFVPKNDANVFGKFGKFFYSYVDNKKEYPDYEDMLNWLSTEE